MTDRADAPSGYPAPDFRCRGCQGRAHAISGRVRVQHGPSCPVRAGLHRRHPRTLSWGLPEPAQGDVGG